MGVQTGGGNDKTERSDDDRPVLSRRPEPGSPEDAKESKINATQIHSKVVTSFTITLAANHTTGYSWRLAQPLDSAILKQLGEKYRRTTQVASVLAG